ncbi:hypothetical protein [Pseudothermotoga sp.]
MRKVIADTFLITKYHGNRLEGLLKHPLSLRITAYSNSVTEVKLMVSLPVLELNKVEIAKPTLVLPSFGQKDAASSIALPISKITIKPNCRVSEDGIIIECDDELNVKYAVLPWLNDEQQAELNRSLQAKHGTINGEHFKAEFEPVNLPKIYGYKAKMTTLNKRRFSRSRYISNTAYVFYGFIQDLMWYANIERMEKVSVNIEVEREAEPFQLVQSRPVRKLSEGCIEVRVIAQLWKRNDEAVCVAVFEVYNLDQPYTYLITAAETKVQHEMADFVFELPDGFIVSSDESAYTDDEFILRRLQNILGAAGSLRLLSYNMETFASSFSIHPADNEVLLKELVKELALNHRDYMLAIPGKRKIKSVSVQGITTKADTYGDELAVDFDANPIFFISRSKEKTGNKLKNMLVTFDGKMYSFDKCYKNLFSRAVLPINETELFKSFENIVSSCSLALPYVVSTGISMALKNYPNFELAGFVVTSDMHLLILGDVEGKSYGMLFKIKLHKLWTPHWRSSEPSTSVVFYMVPLILSEAIAMDNAVIVADDRGSYMVRYDEQSDSIEVIHNELITLWDIKGAR